jgi:hypothetical protein
VRCFPAVDVLHQSAAACHRRRRFPLLLLLLLLVGVLLLLVVVLVVVLLLVATQDPFQVPHAVPQRGEGRRVLRPQPLHKQPGNRNNR